MRKCWQERRYPHKPFVLGKAGPSQAPPTLVNHRLLVYPLSFRKGKQPGCIKAMDRPLQPPGFLGYVFTKKTAFFAILGVFLDFPKNCLICLVP